MREKEILETLKLYKAILKKKYGIKEIGVFGSVARKEMKENSDVDIVILIDNPDPFNLLNLKHELSQILNCKVDVVRMRKNLNKFLKKRIEKEAIYV